MRKIKLVNRNNILSLDLGKGFDWYERVSEALPLFFFKQNATKEFNTSYR